MKKEELMIGDLVRVSKDVSIKKGTIVEIRAIDADRNFQELKGCATCVPINDTDGLSGGVWLDYLEPIPLTAEILEKNGFALDDEWYIYTGQGVNIDVAFRDDNKFVYDLSILTGSGSMDIHAKYVHELQHALRLCGITHEIIL